MAKDLLKLDLQSALSRKAEQHKDSAPLPVAMKLKLLDQLHDNATFLASLRPKRRATNK